MAGDIHRDIGAHAEAINTLKTEFHAMREDIAEIKSLIAQSKGGVRMLIAVGSIAATLAGLIGAAISKLFPWGHS